MLTVFAISNLSLFKAEYVLILHPIVSEKRIYQNFVQLFFISVSKYRECDITLPEIPKFPESFELF